jgi:hypothetical protein
VKLETSSVALFVLVGGGNPHFCTVEDFLEMELPASKHVLKSNNKINSGDIMVVDACFEGKKKLCGTQTSHQ